jgi:Calx-beta domain-containing protein
MDILLVGPGGQNATVMSDAGSYYPIDGTFTLDDEATGPVPDSTAMTPGSYQPANHTESLDTDPFVPPAPTPSGGSALSVFDGTNPNGTWSLFVVEDTGSGPAGRINDWSLQITDAGFKPTFTATGGKVKEGKKATFKVSLSAAPLIPFDVPFTTVPGSAKAGKDFTAAAGNLTFAPGETSKNVVVKTKNDPKDEKSEKFSLQLTTTTGNISATAKIKDNDK